MLDPDALEKAIDKIAKDRLMKELRELIIYHNPPIVADLFAEYQRQVDLKKKPRKRRSK